MSTVAAPAPSLVNGAGTSSTDVLRETDFLQNLLQIRDDVFTNKHPRIRLPAKVIEQAAPHLSRRASKPIINSTPSNASTHSLPPRPAQAPHQPTNPLPLPSRPGAAKSASSSIDPVLLTKSDHLIKAELQLKRQQIERQLKDQFDKKGRGNDADEREAAIHVEDCFIKAHIRVPPTSGLNVAANNSEGAESFDENSYYSSKADSWSEGEADRDQNANAGAMTPHVAQLRSTTNHTSNHSKCAESIVIDLDDEAYEPADDIEIYEADEALSSEEAEEEDYSPPPADTLPNSLHRSHAHDGGTTIQGTNGSSRRRKAARPTSPLFNPRKRGREAKLATRKRRKQTLQTAGNRPAQSPEPYIKEEPQSPPPVIEYHESQPSKQRALPPLDSGYEYVSSSTVRPHPVYYRDREEMSRSNREYIEPWSPSFIGTPQRRMLRDDQDLRRVASFQNNRQPYSPGDGSFHGLREPWQHRAMSYAYAERPEAPSVYSESSARPLVTSRYPREQSRSPRREYLAPKQVPLSIPPPPPPRRIVVDEFGNQFYAEPYVRKEFMGPPSRRLEADVVYERTRSREPTMRAPARTEYHEEDMMPMPPPPRRYVEAGLDMLESPSQRQREPSRRPVEVDYRPVPQYDEVGRPREYMPSRAYSMRPDVTRRDVPEGHSRHESIQPMSSHAMQGQYSEVSNVHDGGRSNGQCMSVPQGRRYVGEGHVEYVQDQCQAETRHMYPRY